MYRSSQLLHKEIIDADNQKRLGVLTAVAYDKPNNRCLFVTEGKTYSADKILARDCIFATNPVETDAKPVIYANVRVYDTAARFKGEIVDCELGKTMKLAAIRLSDDTRLTRGRIYALGDILIVKNNKSKPSKRTSVTQATPIDIPSNTETHKFNKKYGDFSFLLGKVADRSITNFQGETMIKRGETITRDLLRQAKISGKLIELCLHVK